MGNSDITVHEFDHLKNHDNIVHGIFARSGRTSRGEFDSLNIGMNPGDKRSAIADNRELIIKKMGMKPLIFLNQVHGAEIKILKKAENYLSESFQPGKEAYTADGIITDMKDVFLVILVADCQAVILYDHEKKVIANIHSGWRGSVKNIIGKCVAQMISEFACEPDNIIAGISPSLGPCCSEFVNYRDEIPESLWKYKIEDKDYFDFWEMSCDQLMDKGIKKANIENMEICTRCNMDEFYSYRGEKTTGRFACAITLV
ncbi:MAG: peptidoglycan editing factor PgeF [Thermodesulfobacteriota bacterium]